jgi:hypothetical protein
MQLAFEGDTPIPATEADHIAMASPHLALGWVFIRPCFARNGEPLDAPLENMTVTWTGCSNTIYRTAFYDTASGDVILQKDLRAENNQLTFRLPPLTRDVAFKIRLAETTPTPEPAP